MVTNCRKTSKVITSCCKSSKVITIQQKSSRVVTRCHKSTKDVTNCQKWKEGVKFKPKLSKVKISFQKSTQVVTYCYNWPQIFACHFKLCQYCSQYVTTCRNYLKLPQVVSNFSLSSQISTNMRKPLLFVKSCHNCSDVFTSFFFNSL